MSSETPLEFEKTRSLKQILSDTFLFLKVNFIPLGTALVVIAGPFLLLTALYNSTLIIKILTNAPKDSPIGIFDVMTNQKFESYFLYNYIFIFVTSIIVGAVVFEYVVLYIENSQERVRLNVLFNTLMHDFLHILAAGVVSGVLIISGLSLFLAPGIYVSVMLAPIFMVILYEQVPVFDSIIRCFHLISGNWWNTFKMLLILSILLLFLSMIIGLPENLASALATVAKTSSGIPPAYQLGILLTSIISSLGYLLNSIPMVAVAFHYFNLADQHPPERSEKNTHDL